MKTKGPWVLVLNLLSIAAPLALVRCSGVNPPNLGNIAQVDSSAGSSSGSGGGSGSSSGSGSGSGSSSSGDQGSSGSGSSSGGVDLDAGLDASEGGTESPDTGAVACDTPEGGAPCDPGIVACGDAGCSTSASACCQGGVLGTSSCQPSSTTCSNGGTKVQCDEASDCPSGFVCCETFPGFATLGATSCQKACSGTGSYQICRSNSECGQGSDSGARRCVLQSCNGGRTAVTVEACAVAGTTNNGALPYCTAM